MSTKQISQMFQNADKRLLDIAEKEIPKASNSAMNKTIKRVETRVVRGVAKQTNIPNKLIRKKVYIRRSTVKTQRARLTVYRRDVSLVSVLSPGVVARRLGRPTSGRNHRTLRWKGRAFPGAFVANSPSGKPQVFKRRGKARLPLDTEKLPIRGAVDSIAPKVAERAMRNDFPQLLTHELNYRVAKKNGV